MGDTKNGLLIIKIFCMYYDKKLPICISIIPKSIRLSDVFHYRDNSAVNINTVPLSFIVH